MSYAPDWAAMLRDQSVLAESVKRAAIDLEKAAERIAAAQLRLAAAIPERMECVAAGLIADAAKWPPPGFETSVMMAVATAARAADTLEKATVAVIKITPQAQNDR